MENTKFQSAVWDYVETQVNEGENINVVFESRRAPRERNENRIIDGGQVWMSWDCFGTVYVSKATF